MATATRTKTWVDAEEVNFDDANANWNTLFTFFGAAGSVAHNDGSQAFSADIGFPRSFSSQDSGAIRKYQADRSCEITGGSPNCWLHGAAHLPALGALYMMAGEEIFDSPGFGAYDIGLPATFATDILTVIVGWGDDAPTASSTHLYLDASASTTSLVRVVAIGADPGRFSWIAIGW